MTDIDTLVHARWVIPVVPRAAILERHAIAIADGKIVDVLASAEATQRYRAASTHTLETHALTPGLVNCHTHAAMALLRGVGDDLPLMRWLKERIWPLESALVSADFVHDGTQLAALEMLRSGTTTCSDMYFYPDASLRALRSMGLRAVAGIIAIEFPTAYAADAEDYLRKGLATRDAFRNDPLVSFTLAPHAPYTVADQTLRRIAVLAEELDLPIHTHVHETEDEIAESVAKHGCRPLQRLDRLGIVSERLIAVHAVHLNEHEIALLAQRGYARGGGHHRARVSHRVRSRRRRLFAQGTGDARRISQRYAGELHAGSARAVHRCRSNAKAHRGISRRARLADPHPCA